MGFGRGKNDGPPDPANEQESAQIVVDAAGEGLGKLTSRVLGANVGQLGSVSVVQGAEYKGWADATIPALVDRLNARGGIIAQIAQTLVKNGVIQDQSQFQDLAEGVGGGDALLANSGTMAPASVPNESGAGDDRGGGMTT